MANDRVSQVAVEVVVKPTPPMRTSQVVLEVLVHPQGPADPPQTSATVR